LFGAWPDGLLPDDQAGLSVYAERIVGWQEKSLREAKLRSSWEAPETDYEERCHAVARGLLDAGRSGAFLADVRALLDLTAAATQANALVQTALRYTVPGVPDLYQGAELSDLSLVDPDNRRPVDYALRARWLDTGGDAKQALIARLLALRVADPAVFAEGAYAPIAVEGLRARHVLAFTRTLAGRSLRVAVALRCPPAAVDDAAAWWGDTTLATGEQVADLFADAPVWVEGPL